MYDENFLGLEGFNYPENGKRVFQEDFELEQTLLAQEVIEREADYISFGVIEGGEVTLSATTGCIDISKILARDKKGRRLQKGQTNSFPVPDGQTVIISARHKWIFSDYVNDGSGGQISRSRRHSAEIVYLPENEQPTDRDVFLRKVSRNGTVITFGEDLRIRPKMKDVVELELEKKFPVSNENLAGGITNDKLVGNIGTNPIGTILALLHGYFSSSNNEGFSSIPVDVDDSLRFCDGSAPNDPESPIWNSPSRHLPNLTNNRFIMGSTESGVVGGKNTLNDHIHSSANSLGEHSHHWGGKYVDGTSSGGHGTGTVSSDHSHGIGDPGHAHHSYWDSNYSAGGSVVGPSNNWTNPGWSNYTHGAGTGIWTGGISANHTHGYDLPWHQHYISLTETGNNPNLSHNHIVGNGVPVNETECIPNYLTVKYYIKIK